jgi:putative glutamine amidotransferase
MPKPIVGITTGRRRERAAPRVRPTVVAGIPGAYPTAVERSGGAPLLLPCTQDPKVIEAVMAVVDGLLLSGGGDIAPHRYGAEPHPAEKNQDPVRDEMEFQAVRIAVQRKVPILGICRGIQTLNVAMGGTIIQDIPSQVPGAVRHDVPASKRHLGHVVDIEPGSLLARVLGTTCLPVNSRHHQAVRDVAPHLRVNSRSRDGVIEGVEADDGRPVLAVQCHPETCCEDYPVFQRLFDWLVAEAARRRRRRSVREARSRPRKRPWFRRA